MEEQFTAKLEEAEKELKSLLPEDWVPSTTGSEGEKSPNEGDAVEGGPALSDKENTSENENAEKIAQLTLVVKYLRVSTVCYWSVDILRYYIHTFIHVY